MLQSNQLKTTLHSKCIGAHLILFSNRVDASTHTPLPFAHANQKFNNSLCCSMQWHVHGARLTLSISPMDSL